MFFLWFFCHFFGNLIVLQRKKVIICVFRRQNNESIEHHSCFHPMTIRYRTLQTEAGIQLFFLFLLIRRQIFCHKEDTP